MSEAERGASALEALCQQMMTLTQAVQSLQDGYFQLEGHLHSLTASMTPADPNQATSSTVSTPTASLPATATLAVRLPPLEPRVPTPERFSGDQWKFRAFNNACELYFALQPKTFSLETIKVGFIISLLLA